MSAARIIRRRAWISDHPPQFNRTNKERAAYQFGGKLRPRLSFQLWMIKTFEPERYAEMERIARGEEKKAEKDQEQRDAKEARENFVEATQ